MGSVPGFSWGMNWGEDEEIKGGIRCGDASGDYSAVTGAGAPG
jgi:hypothetical protein